MHCCTVTRVTQVIYIKYMFTMRPNLSHPKPFTMGSAFYNSRRGHNRNHNNTFSVSPKTSTETIIKGLNPSFGGLVNFTI